MRLCQNMPQLIKITPKTPAFVNIPDSRADAGAGATGCALGSQICRGKAPALAPNPINRQTPAGNR